MKKTAYYRMGYCDNCFALPRTIVVKNGKFLEAKYTKEEDALQCASRNGEHLKGPTIWHKLKYEKGRKTRFFDLRDLP